jgi:predicted nucleic acid-binding protein
MELGVLQLLRRDLAQGEVLHNWLHQQVLTSFNDRILPIDSEIAMRCAALHVPVSRSPYDALIAATALIHQMTVVTRNTADFAPTGVPTLNPWLA